MVVISPRGESDGREATDAERNPDADAAYAVFIADETYSDPEHFARSGDERIFQSNSVVVFRRAELTTHLSTR